MRIVHVHRMRGIGGSERHLLTLLPALAERGLDIVFVGLDDPAWDPSDFYGALRVPALSIPSPRDLDPLLLGRLVRRLRADVVHTHLVHADVYGGLAAKLRGAALVSTKHNDDPFRTGAFRFVERGLARMADRVVAITDSLRLPLNLVKRIDAQHLLPSPTALWRRVCSFVATAARKTLGGEQCTCDCSCHV